MSDPIPNQIDYTSRDYSSLRADLIERVRRKVPEWVGDDPADFGVVLLEAFAYMGDVLSYYIDRAANESSLATATRRSSVIALARQLGYQPSGFRSSKVQVSFGNSSDSTIVVPARTVVSAILESDDSLVSIPFETDAAVEVPAGESASVQATQGEVVRGDTGFGIELGLSDGRTGQRFSLPDRNVVAEEVEVFTFDGVNYSPWKRVDYLSDYTSLSRVFSVLFDSSGAYAVAFGDGVSGFIPPSGHQIFARYRVSDGSRGNVPVGSISEITEIPGLTSSQIASIGGVLSVTNYALAIGGANEQSTESIRVQAPRFFRSAHRAVTVRDFEGIALGVSGCDKASAISETLGSVVVAVAPYRDTGYAEDRPGFEFDDPDWVQTPEMINLLDRVRNALDDAKLIGTAVSVIEPVYVPVEIGLTVEVIPTLGRDQAAVLIREEILTRMDYSSTDFGARIYISDVISLITDLGVTTSVSIDLLKRSDDEEGTVENITSAFDEILRVSPDDITLVLTGGAEGELETL